MGFAKEFDEQPELNATTEITPGGDAKFKVMDTMPGTVMVKGWTKAGKNKDKKTMLLYLKPELLEKINKKVSGSRVRGVEELIDYALYMLEKEGKCLVIENLEE